MIEYKAVPISFPDATEQQKWLADRKNINRVFVNVAGPYSASLTVTESTTGYKTGDKPLANGLGDDGVKGSVSTGDHESGDVTVSFVCYNSLKPDVTLAFGTATVKIEQARIEKHPDPIVIELSPVDIYPPE